MATLTYSFNAHNELLKAIRRAQQAQHINLVFWIDGKDLSIDADWLKEIRIVDDKTDVITTLAQEQ